MKATLENKGLVVIELSEKASNVGSGAVFAYDDKWLKEILSSGKHILEKNNRPTTPKEFVNHLKVYAQDQELFRLIMEAFNDPRLHK